MSVWTGRVDERGGGTEGALNKLNQTEAAWDLKVKF